MKTIGIVYPSEQATGLFGYHPHLPYFGTGCLRQHLHKTAYILRTGLTVRVSRLNKGKWAFRVSSSLSVFRNRLSPPTFAQNRLYSVPVSLFLLRKRLSNGRYLEPYSNPCNSRKMLYPLLSRLPLALANQLTSKTNLRIEISAGAFMGRTSDLASVPLRKAATGRCMTARSACRRASVHLHLQGRHNPQSIPQPISHEKDL